MLLEPALVCFADAELFTVFSGGFVLPWRGTPDRELQELDAEAVVAAVAIEAIKTKDINLEIRIVSSSVRESFHRLCIAKRVPGLERLWKEKKRVI